MIWLSFPRLPQFGPNCLHNLNDTPLLLEDISRKLFRWQMFQGIGAVGVFYIQITRDKAAGQLEAAMERLEAEFGCKTIEEAEKKLTKMEREMAKAEEVFNKAVVAFEEKWDAQLNDTD